MRYLSVCSGIEAATAAWHPLGWSPVAFSEVDAFPSAVLAHHYPGVPNWGDMTKFQEWPDACVCASGVDGKQKRPQRAAGQRRGVGGDVHVEHDGQAFRCDHCQRFFAQYRCSAATHGECDCPKCQGMCVCRNGSGVCGRCGGTAIDLLVGGTPCQSFSVAGLRKGLADPRGNLALTFLALVDRYRPRWVVWENVPGVFSADSHDGPDPCPPPPPVGVGCDGATVETEDDYDSDESHAFSCLLAGFSELGYFGAYGTLDAQYAGLAQRRQRVFAVFHSGEWQRAAAVLFDATSLSGHPAPRREAGQVAPTVPARRSGGCGLGTDFDCDGGLIAGAVTSKWAKGTGGPAGDECYNLTVAHALRADGFDASEDGTGRGTPLAPMAFDARQSNVTTYGDQSGPLDTNGHSIAIAFSAKDHGSDAGDIAPTLRAGGHVGSHADGGVMPAVAFQTKGSNIDIGDISGTFGTNADRASGSAPMLMQHMAVRRLTPRECERLQGFPDDYTLIPYRGKLAADGPRYKALGNSMAVPVMVWIGRRIQMVDELE